MSLIALLAVSSNMLFGLIPCLFFVLLLFLAGVVLRNPRRKIPAAPLSVLSPASGKILAIDAVNDPWLSRSAIRFRVGISLWDVHALGSPIEGKVMNEWTTGYDEPGFDRCYTYSIKTDEGVDVVVSLLMGKWATIVGKVLHAGERIGQGQTCGFFYFTGTIEVFIPAGSRIAIRQGDQVSAGTGVLGLLIHEEGSRVYRVHN